MYCNNDCITHINLVNIIYEELLKKDYVTYIRKNYQYSRGEYDIIAKQDNHFAYYEIKSTNTYKARARAKKQTKRGTKFWHERTGLDCYGIYVTPTKMRIIAKNGVIRKW